MIGKIWKFLEGKKTWAGIALFSLAQGYEALVAEGLTPTLIIGAFGLEGPAVNLVKIAGIALAAYGTHHKAKRLKAAEGRG